MSTTVTLSVRDAPLAEYADTDKWRRVSPVRGRVLARAGAQVAYRGNEVKYAERQVSEAFNLLVWVGARSIDQRNKLDGLGWAKPDYSPLVEMTAAEIAQRVVRDEGLRGAVCALLALHRGGMISDFDLHCSVHALFR